MTEEIPCRGLLIGGEWRTGTAFHDVRFPYDGRVVSRVSLASVADVRKAIDSAAAASARGPLAPARRAEILRAAAGRIRDRAADLARIVALESGKATGEARGEVARSILLLEEFAEEARRIRGEMVPVDGVAGSEDRLAYTVRMPIGVVAAITPFNGPLLSPVHKVGAALASGNAVILKPATATPLAALELAAELLASGLPADLLQVVVGNGADIGDALVDDPRIGMVSFTGSTAVGLRIRARLGLRRSILELGGNAPLIVHEDGDVEAAAQAAVSGSFGYSGQVCISVQRILVQRNVRSRFEAAFLPRVTAMRVGDPLDESTDIGPMLTPEKAAEAEAAAQEAVAAGATALTPIRREGALLWPIVLADADLELPVVCREVFAPLVNLHSYDTLDEAISIANSTDYGLQAGIFTSSLSVALTASRRLAFGGVIVNDTSRFRVDRMPYGGVKSSGYGKEGARYSMREMSDERIVVLRGDPA